MSRRRGRRNAGTVWLTVFTLLAAVVASALLATWWVQRPGEDDRLRDLDGNEVTLPGLDPEASRVRTTGERFEMPELGLSVPLLSAVVAAGQINPPTLTDAYWYREFGDPDRPATGTVVVAMHAVRGGRGPGNALAEPAERGSAEVLVAEGDLIRVGSARYRVSQTAVQSKLRTKQDRRIWGTPARAGSAGAGRYDLAVITCLVDPDVPLAKQANLVVLAERLK